MYTHIYIHFTIFFWVVVCPGILSSSLCCPVVPCYLLMLYISLHLHSLFLETTMHYASNSYFRYLLKSTFKFLKWILLMTKKQGHF